jgi:RNA polymerase sigma factor (sigma-70 family)
VPALGSSVVRDQATIDALLRRARGGDAGAVEALVREVAGPVHRLALRMLWHPQDAEDATQEILVKLVTRLDSFRGEAAFTTWAHRVAANHLLSMRRGRAEAAAMSFAAFGDDLAHGLDEPFDAGGVDERLLEEEVKIGCTQAMLLCLDRDHRMAYILGEVFELPGEQAAEVLAISHAAYRKRLARARARVRGFMAGHCGLVDPANPCRCGRRVGAAIRQGRMDPANLLFAGRRGAPGAPVRHGIAAMEALHDAAAVMRSHPAFEPPERVLDAVRRMLPGPEAPLG